MADITLTGLEKVAILLKNLPGDTADKVLKHLSADHSKLVRAAIETAGARKDIKEALAKVLDEVTDALKADTAAEDPQATSNGKAPRDHAEGNTAASRPPAPAQPKVGSRVDISVDEPPATPTSEVTHADPMRAVAAEPPELLTMALESENARTISLLLNSMEVDGAGAVFKRLSAAKRKEVSICFTEQNTISPDLVTHIAQAVVRKCRELRTTQQALPGVGDSGGREKRVAAMLRGLERAERMETLGVLEETDAELATRVKSMLYQFEDILRMDNPSVQKLLSDTDTKSLALAMSGAPKEIHEKLLKNLSKRAQESLKEEVELMGTVQAARSQQARQSIVEAIQRLDQRGELVLVE